MKSILVAFLLSLGLVSTAKAVTVTGTISLPNNVIAGSAGVELDVSTFPIQIGTVNGMFQISSDTVSIAPGQRSANYSFPIPDDSNSETFRLNFECNSGCLELGVTTEGFWSLSNGVTSLINATEFNARVDNNIAITLESADTFSGVVKFPAGFSANGDESVFVTIRDSGFLGLNSYLSLQSPAAGATSVSFAIGVPNGGANGGWFVEVSCLSCNATISPASQYATTLSGDPLSEVESQRFFYRKNNNYTGLNMTLIALEPPSDTSSTVVPILGLLLDD